MMRHRVKAMVKYSQCARIFNEPFCPQFDELAERCRVPLKRCGDYIECYNLVLKRFKEKCADCGMLTEPRPSLEDCILGIRECLKQLGYVHLQVC